MDYTIQAACACHQGKIRRNNEDNFFFGGRCMEADNQGLNTTLTLEASTGSPQCLVVLDGMGGESFGEIAAFSAARELRDRRHRWTDRFVPSQIMAAWLAQRMNQAVVQAAKERSVSAMGSTLAMLYMNGGTCCVCNLGDSRVYRLREGVLTQLSRDHVAARPMKNGRKPGLTRYLGMDPEKIRLEPHIIREKLNRGDRYLLCSDGLTDMLGDSEIAGIMQMFEKNDECAAHLIRAALDRGGRDNVTVIVCKIL